MSTTHYLADIAGRRALDLDKFCPCYEQADGTYTFTAEDIAHRIAETPEHADVWRAVEAWWLGACDGRPLRYFSEHHEPLPWMDDDFQRVPGWTVDDLHDRLTAWEAAR